LRRPFIVALTAFILAGILPGIMPSISRDRRRISRWIDSTRLGNFGASIFGVLIVCFTHQTG
jgi:hypothetical protein